MLRPNTSVGGKTGRRARHSPERPDTTLVVSDLALSDEAVGGVIDDWIVPALVERFLNVRPLPDSSEEGHN
jgi:hypothetical protein